MEKKQLCHRFYRGYVKKLLMLMKLCLLFICVFTLTLSASSFAQQERVSLDLKNVSVKVLLDEIQKQTNWCFLFNPEQTKQLGKLSLRVENETVEEVLNRILKDTDLTFKFKNDLIMIVPKDEVEDDKSKKDIRIVGQVTDNKKLPLPGVTVIVKGLTIGTATDGNGRYALTLPKTALYENGDKTKAYAIKHDPRFYPMAGTNILADRKSTRLNSSH